MHESLFSHWWLTIDRWAFFTICFIALCGILLVSAASPAVAGHIGLGPGHFILKHGLYLLVSFAILIAVSLLSPLHVVSFCALGFFLSALLVIATALWGMEIKGARRWLMLGGFSLQASEFLKPFALMMTGWLFAQYHKTQNPHYLLANGILLVLSLGLLISQPDMGMTVLLSVCWGIQLFLFGISYKWIGIFLGLGSLGSLGAYLSLSHVRGRIHRFLNPDTMDRYGDGYQLHQSLDAFASGGLFGKGPGEGIIKRTLPDAHADFIFAVCGEEFGLILSLIILGLYLFFAARMLLSFWESKESEAIYMGTGLTALFLFQAFINMGSTVGLIPTKGMTLPFISYGGSSLMATGMTLGILLGLTRRYTPYKSQKSVGGFGLHMTGGKFYDRY